MPAPFLLCCFHPTRRTVKLTSEKRPAQHVVAPSDADVTVRAYFASTPRAKQAEQIGGWRVIVVHAKDEAAQAFYAKYGFIAAKDDPLTLFFPIEFEL